MSGKNTVKFQSLAVLLIIADQAIKLIIQNNFLKLHFHIIGGFLYFQPMHNTKLSWLNSLLGTNVGFIPHIITNLIILILLIWSYRYAKSVSSIPFPIQYSYTFILSGAACSVIDKLFWGGSLDFVGLFTWFIFDTKDLYITIGVTVFVIYFLIYFVKNPKAVNGSTMDDIRMLKDFAAFIKEDFGRLYGKIFTRQGK